MRQILEFLGAPLSPCDLFLERFELRQQVMELKHEPDRAVPDRRELLVVPPTDLSVLRPIKGKNIASLQTCTLPDYSDRVIYQGELKDIKA